MKSWAKGVTVLARNKWSLSVWQLAPDLVSELTTLFKSASGWLGVVCIPRSVRAFTDSVFLELPKKRQESFIMLLILCIQGILQKSRQEMFLCAKLKRNNQKLLIEWMKSIWYNQESIMSRLVLYGRRGKNGDEDNLWSGSTWQCIVH